MNVLWNAYSLKGSLTDLAGESPVAEVEPIILRSESCDTVGNE